MVPPLSTLALSSSGVVGVGTLFTSSAVLNKSFAGGSVFFFDWGSECFVFCVV